MCIRDRDLMSMYQFGLAVAEVFGQDKGLVTQVSKPSSQNTSAERAEHRLKTDILGLDCNQTSQRLKLPDFSVITGLKEMLGLPV